MVNQSRDWVMTQPTDTVFVDRDRTARWIVLGLYVILVPTVIGAFGWWLSGHVENDIVRDIIFWTVFIIGVTVTGASIESLFVIRNNTTSMFVTIDQWRSLLNKDDVNVAYGPGTHIAFPWEVRLRENNISLEEAAQDFEFAVQCSDGLISGSGSFRLRPNLTSAVTFLNSAAGVASEIRDLIISEIINRFGGKSVKDAIDGFADLNDFLQSEFADYEKPHEVERRYGIIITDVTVSEILPSKDVQKTLSGLAEATAIAAGTEIMLGIPEGELGEWLANGKVSQGDVKEARDRFMAVSGNLEGMDISRNEYDFNIRGLDPEVARELSNVLRSPGAQAYMSNRGKNNNNRRNRQSGNRTKQNKE